jgi:hypothetical protein
VVSGLRGSAPLAASSSPRKKLRKEINHHLPPCARVIRTLRLQRSVGRLPSWLRSYAIVSIDASVVHVGGHGDNVIVAELDQRVTAGIGWPDAADQRDAMGRRRCGTNRCCLDNRWSTP